MIRNCDIEHFENAMDMLMNFYTANRDGGGSAAWVQAHCEAKPAIPRNKWVCTDTGVTREYR